MKTIGGGGGGGRGGGILKLWRSEKNWGGQNIKIVGEGIKNLRRENNKNVEEGENRNERERGK